VTRVNSDLVGKITNLASRGAQMLKKKMDGVMTAPDAQGAALIRHAQEKSEEIAKHYEARDFVKATNEIRALADKANQYFDEKAPWKTLESDPKGTKEVLTTTLNVFRILAIYLKPVLPHYTAKVEKLFGENPYQWADVNKVLTNASIQDYEHLASRIEADKVKAMVEEAKALNEKVAAEKKAANTAAPKAATTTATAATSDGKSGEITFDEFMKVDLRVGTVVDAEEIKEADKLLRLKIDIGGGEIRQIISGIKAAYAPEKLKGRQVLVCVNLAPRKMKFGMSEGMVLAAGEGGSDLYVLSPDTGAKTGQRVK
jgi:methionyl-tRNA synthetase